MLTWHKRVCKSVLTVASNNKLVQSVDITYPCSQRYPFVHECILLRESASLVQGQIFERDLMATTQYSLSSSWEQKGLTSRIYILSVKYPSSLLDLYTRSLRKLINTFTKFNHAHFNCINLNNGKKLAQTHSCE